MANHRSIYFRRYLGFIPEADQYTVEEVAELDLDENSSVHENITYVYVVIDGYHVRRELGRYNETIRAEKSVSAKDISDWLDKMDNWILERYTDKNDIFSAVSIQAVAWDSDLSSDQEKGDEFKYLTESTKELLIKSRSSNLYKFEPKALDYIWNFVDIRMRLPKGFKGLSENPTAMEIRDSYQEIFQSGVDARISAEIFRGYLQKANHIILVTADSDFLTAVEVINHHSGKSIVELLTMRERGVKAYKGAASKRWKWVRPSKENSQGNIFAEEF